MDQFKWTNRHIETKVWQVYFTVLENCPDLFVHRYCKFFRTFSMFWPVFGFVENILFRRSVGWSFCIFHQLSRIMFGFYDFSVGQPNIASSLFSVGRKWKVGKSRLLVSQPDNFVVESREWIINGEQGNRWPPDGFCCNFQMKAEFLIFLQICQFVTFCLLEVRRGGGKCRRDNTARQSLVSQQLLISIK